MAGTARPGMVAARAPRSLALGAGAIGCLVFVAMPADSAGSPIVYGLVSLAALVALVAGVARIPGPARAPWWGVLGYVTCAFVGDLVYNVQVWVLQVEPSPGPSDVIFLAGYLFALYGLAVLIRRVQPGHSREGWIDTAILTVSAAAVIGTLVVQPTLAANQGGSVQLGIAVGYPLFDLLIFAGVARLLVGSGPVNSAVALVAAAFAVTLVADLLYSYIEVGGLGGSAPAWLDALYLVVFIMLALAAWRPSAASIRPKEDGGNQRYRLAGLTIGALLVPVMLVIAARADSELPARRIAMGTVIVVALVLWRFRLLLDVVEGQSARLAVLARTDALTGLPNRRTLDHELERLDVAGPLTTGPLTIAMLDLDRFKDYNDQHGHQAGDHALAHCTRAWRAALPPDATLARYGGEEFALLLPGHHHGDAAALLEAVRTATPAPHTVSIGYSQQRPGETAYDTLNRADRALYQAKANGRNRVETLA
ncbi:MAG: diguanylate cyclase [Actinomycetota bacterium]|nr:diguanylate cyclase [Actinomycetota bacterium]